MLDRLCCFAPLSFVVLASACVSGPPLDAVPADLADAWCENIEACAPVPLFGPDQCQSSFEGLFRATLLANADALIERGTVRYDATAASECITAYRNRGCDLLIAATPAACRSVLAGTIGIGESCSDSSECAGDAYCDRPACPTTRGTCAARKANGATCASDDECQNGLKCDAGSCGPPASQSGGPCGGSSGRTCPIDELCVGAEGSDPGTCTPFDSLRTAALGEDCRLGDEGGPMILCQEGLSCAVIGIEGLGPDFECVEPVEAGAACNDGLPDMCPLGQYCDAEPAMLMFDGTCTPLPTQGQPCAEVTFGARCATGLACGNVDGEATCVRVQENGASCGIDAECFSGNCDGGTCSGPPICPPA